MAKASVATALVVLAAVVAMAHSARVFGTANEALASVGMRFRDLEAAREGRHSPSKKVRRVSTPKRCAWKAQGEGARVCHVIGSSTMPLADPVLAVDLLEFGPGHGLPQHPHRGYHTFTMVDSGAFVERTFLNEEYTVRAGDMKWVSSGSGVLHTETATKDGPMTGWQLYWNVPKVSKMDPPRHQVIHAADFPEVNLPTHGHKGTATAKVVAGALSTTTGPATVERDATIAVITVSSNTHVHVPVNPRMEGVVVVLDGKGTFGSDRPQTPEERERRLHFDQGRVMAKHQAAHLPVWRHGLSSDELYDDLVVTTKDESVTFLLAAGVPLHEGLYQRGLMYMTNRREVDQAYKELKAGTFVKVPEHSEL